MSKVQYPPKREYNKLVRDRIPEIIRQQGLDCEVIRLSESEYRQALREKLIEEAKEASRAGDRDLVRELADLCEVIDAMMAAYGISQEIVNVERERKRQERGCFSERLQLLWVEIK